MSHSTPASLNAIVRGRVQGVFFRAFVQTHANSLGLTGYVRNLQSGAVEVHVEGNKRKLEELLQNLYKGPPAAKVEDIEVSWGEYNGTFSGFSVRF